MTEGSRGLLFRKRNILGAALVAGLGVGIYLGQKWPFFGIGGNFGIGANHSKDTSAKSSDANPDATSDENSDVTSHEPARVSTVSDGESPVVVPDVVKILIDEREFLLRKPDHDVPITLDDVIKLIQQAPGDAHGIRVRIYEKLTARVSAEEKLKQAMIDANIPDGAIFWVPARVNDVDTRPSDPRKK